MNPSKKTPSDRGRKFINTVLYFIYLFYKFTISMKE